MNRRGPMGRGGFDGGRGSGRGYGTGGRGRGPMDFGGSIGGRGRGGGGGGNAGMSHYGPAASMENNHRHGPPGGGGGRGGGGGMMPPPHMMGRGGGPPGRGIGPGGPIGGRGGGPMMGGPPGPGRGGPMGNTMNRGPHPSNLPPGGMHQRGPGGPDMPPVPPNMMGRDNNRGGPLPPPPPPRGMQQGGNIRGPGGPPMQNMGPPGGNQMMHNQQQMPPPPPPRHGPPIQPPMNTIQNGPPMMGPPNQPPFNNGPPQQHMQINHPHMMNPQVQNNMPPPGPPGPPGMPPNQQMQMQHQQMHGGQQPPFQPNSGPPPNNMMRQSPNNQPPPFAQPGFPPQQQQMQMNQPNNMAPQHLQYQQQQQPMQHMQHHHQQQQQPSPHPFSPNQPPPQLMQQPPPSTQRNAPPQQKMQQPPQSSATTPSTAVSTPTKAASGGADAAWTEHRSPAGVPYFYNTVTGVSTYERPATLPAASAAVTPAPKDAPSANNSATTTTSKPKWQTYTDETTGKKYYSDGVTTTWNRPSELPPEDGAEKAKLKRGVSFHEETPRKKKRSSHVGGNGNDSSPQSLYANKAEAIAAFKGLLLAKDIAPTTKWADVSRICSDDVRWEAASTTGERKQALAEYQTKRANELRDVKRQEKVRAKEAFQRLLTEVLPNAKKFTPGASRFMDIRESLSKDDRFYAVEDETTREELFYEWVEELRKKEERGKRNKKREAKESCVQFLKAKEEEGKLTFASTWSTFVSSLTPSEKEDPRFAIGSNPQHMSDSDRQLYFSDHVIELQNVEDEKRRRIRDARRRAEKAQRDAFRERLVELAKKGLITPETRWRGIEERVSGDASYEQVHAQGREVARELFEDYVYDWKEEYRRDRITLVRVWDMSKNKKQDFAFNGKSSAEDFGKVLLESSAGSPDLYGEIRRMSIVAKKNPLSSIHLLYNELSAAAAAGIAAKNRKNGHNTDGKKKHGNGNDESSEDEGEIIEDEAVVAAEKKKKDA